MKPGKKSNQAVQFQSDRLFQFFGAFYDFLIALKSLHILQQQICMGKTNKEDKSKRYSKISNALKSFFFRLVYVKQMTIKDASRICRLNYSTAKAIIRDLNQKQHEYIEDQINRAKVMKQFNINQNFERSDYRETSSSSEGEFFNSAYEQVVHYNGLVIPKPIKKINIISTTGYDFLKTNDKDS